jgi:hypothetical protein
MLFDKAGKGFRLKTPPAKIQTSGNAPSIIAWIGLSYFKRQESRAKAYLSA